MEQAPLIAILPSPGMGHLIPFVEFAKQLVHRYHFSVTFIIPNIGPEPSAQKALLQELPKNNINCISLPEISFQDLPPGVQNEVKIFLSISRSISFIRDVFKALVDGKRLVYLVVDIFGTDAFDIAKEFNITPYVFFLTTATAVSLMFEFPELDQMGMPDPVHIPGSISISASDLPDPILDSKTNAYKLFLHHASRYKFADGIIINSFLELEPKVIKHLSEDEPDCPPVYPIGPLIQTGSGHHGSDASECLRWLDDQPGKSVLFVSFGSGGTLSSDQLSELALGLEMSKKRFIWVVRSPNDEVSNGAFFNFENLKDPLKSLPKGFLDRTKEFGLVVPNWAPQAQILSHGSTGGFVTHCGWNSILEGIVHGVPLIAWPLYAEQKLNAVVLNEGLNAALRPKVNETGLVVKEEILKIVNGLLDGEEGKRISNRMKLIKDAAALALSENGSSTKSFSNLILKWKNKNST